MVYTAEQREQAHEKTSRKVGEWLQANGHAARFEGMKPADWRAFIAATMEKVAEAWVEVEEGR
jgi:hypothetical protein